MARVTARFSEFLDAMLPAAVPAKERAAFYRLRSEVAHGERLLHRDESRWGMGFAGVTEYMRFERFATISQLAMVNWLLKQPVLRGQQT